MQRNLRDPHADRYITLFQRKSETGAKDAPPVDLRHQVPVHPAALCGDLIAFLEPQQAASRVADGGVTQQPDLVSTVHH